jgi:hypothetical protein
MKHKKNSNILLVGLALLLSLVSFTGVVNHLPNETIKTALVVSNNSEDKSFSIQYQNASKDSSDSFTRYTAYSFTTFLNTYDLKAITVFKTYTFKTLSLNTKQLQTKLYLSIQQRLYNDIV